MSGGRLSVGPGRGGGAGPARRRRALCCGVLALAGIAVGCWRVERQEEEFRGEDEPIPRLTALELARRVIVPGDIRRSIEFLASDDRRGRSTGSPGLERTAAWVGQRFQAVGLAPAGQRGGYIDYWRFPVAGDSVVPVPNVAGFARGNDLTRAREWVILLARLDHLGVGPPDEAGDSIYNGADDNGSGVAALVEIAEALAAVPGGTARPVLFLALSGGEQGREGARRYVADPTVDLDGAVAAVNLWSVSRGRGDGVFVIGQDYSTLGPLFRNVAGEHRSVRLPILPVAALDADTALAWYREGDQLPFARAGIPSVLVTTGRHEDFGRPSDEAARTDPDRAARVARLVFLAALRLANAELDPEWTEEGRRAVR